MATEQQLTVASPLTTRLEALLGATLPPKQKLEQLEGLAHECIVEGMKLIGYFWITLHTIRLEGLWRYAKYWDQQLEREVVYERFEDYAVDYAAEIKEVSPRTIFGNMSKMDTLYELGIGGGTIAKLVSDMPSITDRMLGLGDFDLSDGTFHKLDDTARVRIQAELGVLADELVEDKTLLKEFIERTQELPRQDARALVDRVAGAWTRIMRWDKRNQTLRVKWVQRGGVGNAEIELKLQPNGILPVIARNWLESMMR